MIRVVTGWMEDGYADRAVGVDYNTPIRNRPSQRLEYTPALLYRPVMAIREDLPFGCHTPPLTNFIVGGLNG